MKRLKTKLCLACLLAAPLTCLFAASYTNNTYQKLAKEYTQKAVRALDAGEYALAEEYAQKAKENADLSDQYISSMLARESAQHDVQAAQERLDYVESINGREMYPVAYDAASGAMAQANDAFASEDWEAASSYANQVLDILADVKEITPLPKYYIVRTWAVEKDCFWNISGRSYVYDNPWLWENLYTANKSEIPDPGDPNLILPGMIMEIPSIAGELRDGTYSPDKQYGTFSGR